MRVVTLRNNTNEIVQMIKEFSPNEIYTIPNDAIGLCQKYAHYEPLLTEIVNGYFSVGDGTIFFENVVEQLNWLQGNIPTEVTRQEDVIVTWAQLKAFYGANSKTCSLNYIDLTDRYFVWAILRNQKFYLKDFMKVDATEFETNYINAGKCNILEAERTRITTCKQGRKYHSRYISFDTAQQDDFDNTDYLDQDFGDVTYKMLDVNGQVTTVNADCKQTILDFEPTYDFELSGGILDIPAELAGNDDDAWEVHVLAVPDLTVAQGGSIIFIANPHLKWLKTKQLGVDSSLNPSELKYSATYHTNKIRVIIKHPVGARTNFQINFRIFK